MRAEALGRTLRLRSDATRHSVGLDPVVAMWQIL